jgi:hypothetical protein
VSWPEDGLALASELHAHPGRLALALVAPGLDEGLDEVARLLETSVARVGLSLTSGERPMRVEDLEARLMGGTILTDLDILFWQPQLKIDVLRLLTGLARLRPIVAAWPGQIVGDRATYSRLGRRDYFEGQLTDVVVLRPRQRRFPDQTPFDVEHIPA